MLELITTLAETIRTVKVVPSGELYARLQASLSLSNYQAIVDTLKAAGLIRVENHLIHWIGPV
jgi:hypothetical protein